MINEISLAFQYSTCIQIFAFVPVVDKILDIGFVKPLKPLLNRPEKQEVWSQTELNHPHMNILMTWSVWAQ